jgi:hypothetical protein
MNHWKFKNLKKNRRVKLCLGLLLSTISVFILAYLVDRVLG